MPASGQFNHGWQAAQRTAKPETIKAQLRGKWTPIKSPKDTPSIKPDKQKRRWQDELAFTDLAGDTFLPAKPHKKDSKNRKTKAGLTVCVTCVWAGWENA